LKLVNQGSTFKNLVETMTINNEYRQHMHSQTWSNTCKEID
jgi:hypothetical protein